MAITCCRYCKPPKRTPTCHFDGTCTKYPEQKEAHEAERKEANKKKFTDHNLYKQREEAVKKTKNPSKKGGMYNG